MNERGNVLLHVLVTGVVVALVSAMVLRMALLRYTVGARAHTAAQNMRSDQGVLGAAIAAWGGRVCSATPTSCGGGCAVSACGCSCSCTTGSTPVTLTVSCPAPTGAYPACGQCNMSLNSGTGYSGGTSPF